MQNILNMEKKTAKVRILKSKEHYNKIPYKTTSMSRLGLIMFINSKKNMVY